MQAGSNQKPLLGADNNALVALLAINLVAFVLLGFFKVIYFLDGTPLNYFIKIYFIYLPYPPAVINGLHKHGVCLLLIGYMMAFGNYLPI